MLNGEERKILKSKRLSLLGNPNQSNAFKFTYNAYVNATKTSAQNEVGLLNFLNVMVNGSCVTLMKNSGTTTDPKWGTVTKTSDTNNPVKTTPCPN